MDKDRKEQEDEGWVDMTEWLLENPKAAEVILKSGKVQIKKS